MPRKPGARKRRRELKRVYLMLQAFQAFTGELLRQKVIVQEMQQDYRIVKRDEMMIDFEFSTYAK
jgi:hypothetical protein